MTTSLKLRNRPKADGTYPVLVRAFFRGQTVDFTTGQSIDRKWWNAEDSEIVKPKKGHQEVKDARGIVEAKRTAVQAAMNKLDILRPGFGVRELRSFERGEFDPRSGVVQPFLVWVEDHIENFDKRPLRGKTRAGTEATKRKYRTHLNMLEMFWNETGEELTWENMDADFVRKMKDKRSYWKLSASEDEGKAEEQQAWAGLGV